MWCPVVVSDLCQRSLLEMLFRLAIGSSPGHLKYMVAFKLAGQRLERLGHMSPHVVDLWLLVVDISFGRCEYSSGFPVEFRLDFSTLGLNEPARVKRPPKNPQLIHKVRGGPRARGGLPPRGRSLFTGTPSVSLVASPWTAQSR